MPLVRFGSLCYTEEEEPPPVLFIIHRGIDSVKPVSQNSERTKEKDIAMTKSFTSSIPRPIPADIRKVSITDGFYSPYVEKIRTVTTPDVFRKFLADGAHHLAGHRRNEAPHQRFGGGAPGR